MAMCYARGWIVDAAGPDSRARVDGNFWYKNDFLTNDSIPRNGGRAPTPSASNGGRAPTGGRAPIPRSHSSSSRGYPGEASEECHRRYPLSLPDPQLPNLPTFFQFVGTTTKSPKIPTAPPTLPSSPPGCSSYPPIVSSSRLQRSVATKSKYDSCFKR